MGAWIEIMFIILVFPLSEVAPHMGAWIEIYILDKVYYQDNVAPHMGAWIEIFFHLHQHIPTDCRTPHGCVD